MDRTTLGLACFAIGFAGGGYLGEYVGAHRASQQLVGSVQMLGCSVLSTDGKTVASWRQRADGTCVLADLYRGIGDERGALSHFEVTR